MSRTLRRLIVVAAAAAVAALACQVSAQEARTVLPDVTVTAPATPPAPPYLNDPWTSFRRNPMHGRWRNEEDKFVEQPCDATRLAASVPGGKCLVGYRLTPGPSRCHMGLDVVIFRANGLEVEADILSFDPNRVTVLGALPKQCTITPFDDYGEVDFRDMNQVTRRGSNFRNLVMGRDGADSSIEFFDSNRPCVALRRLGPPWKSGRVWVMHVSICRADARPVAQQDIAWVTGSLQIRIYDAVDNLRSAPSR